MLTIPTIVIIIVIIHMEIAVKMQYNLTTALTKCREYLELSYKATFWFGALFSLAEDIEHKNIYDDASTSQKIQILKILTHGISAMAGFYEQETPHSAFKLLNFGNTVLDLLGETTQYSTMISKVNYLNAVGLYTAKTRQYSHCFDVFGQILQMYNSKVIDNANQSFLAALNNYLCLLRRSNKKLTSRLLEVEASFKQLFMKYFTKLMLNDGNVSKEAYYENMLMLTAIYKQNQSILEKYIKDVNAFATHVFQQQFVSKKKMPQHMIQFLIKNKIRKNVAFKISFNEDQIKFFSATKSKVLSLKYSKRNDEQIEPSTRYKKIQAMLQQSIEMLTEQKVYTARNANLQRSAQLTKLNDSMSADRSILSRTIQNQKSNFIVPQIKPFNTIQPISIKPVLPRTFTRKKDIIGPKPKKPLVVLPRFKTIIFKIHSIFIEVNDDGILLSDYTKQNKRYIQWNTLSMIIQKIDLHFPFEQLLKIPIDTYYDFIRIISFYLTKNDNREICMVGKALPLLQLNELIKLYKQQGKYLKLALMNQYDSDKFVGIVDLYLSEYSQFFKVLNDNQYLSWLNQRIGRIDKNLQERQENIYSIDYLKRKRQTTVIELSNQLLADTLLMPIEQKRCLYKCLFLMKNNLLLYVKIIDNLKNDTKFQDQILEVQIQNLTNHSEAQIYIPVQKIDNSKGQLKINKTVYIPLQKLTQYFPSYSLGVREYVNLYSRMIVDMLNNFQLYVKQQNLSGLTFELVVHACKTQMIEYGKYYSIVSAQLVGSRERIWALVIRYYDMAFVGQKLTVMMNPYHQFLQGAIGSSGEEQSQLMKNLLFGESVKETYNWLKQTNRLERRFNLFEYLNATKLI